MISDGAPWTLVNFSGLPGNKKLLEEASRWKTTRSVDIDIVLLLYYIDIDIDIDIDNGMVLIDFTG